MSLITALLFSLLRLHATSGECPQMSDIPVMMADNSAFTCMDVWQDWGDDLSVNACNDPTGGDNPIGDHTDMDAPEGVYWAMGSIMVLPGCTAYLFYDHNYEGDSLVLPGPTAVYNNHWGVGGPPGPSSFKCRCIQEPISCVPDDEYDVVLVCDNLLGQATTKCTYQQTIGTAFSESASQGMSVSGAVSNAIHAGLFRLFSEDLDISVTTGYDWTHVSEATQSEQITMKIEAEAPPGTVLIIEQAVGHCDGNEARTEMFRTSHQDSKGNIVFQEIVEL